MKSSARLLSLVCVHETTTTNNNRSCAGCGVWGVAAVGSYTRSEGGEPVAEASQVVPPTAKAPDISIIQAAMRGNIEAVKQHLADGADVNVKDNNGCTPLHTATKEIAELLIANGADVNAKDNFKSTPLHFAAREGRGTFEYCTTIS